MGREPASGEVKSRRSHARIAQVDGLEELVERYMGVDTIKASRGRCHQPKQGRHWGSAEAGESQIEPGNVGLQPANRSEDSRKVCAAFETPTTNYIKARQLFSGLGDIISQDREVDAGLLTELIRDRMGEKRLVVPGNLEWVAKLLR